MRLIDANALIHKLKTAIELGQKVDESVSELEAVLDDVESMPTIEIEPQWIPVSERLPEYFEPVLTWDGHCYSVEKRIPYIRDEDGKPIKSEWWVSDDYDELEETDYYPNLRDGAAIAWMPLPEPYEVEDEKTD